MHKNKLGKQDQAKNWQDRESGLIKAFVTFQTEERYARMPLAEAAEAHRLLEARQTTGAMVLLP